MKKLIFILPTLLALALHGIASGAKPTPTAAITFRQAGYDGVLSDDQARFAVTIDVETAGPGSAELLQGDVAILPVKLPGALDIVRDGNRYTLVATRPAHVKFQLEVVAKIQRLDPWNQISFIGPAAAISSITARASGTNTEVQLLEGTLLDAATTNGVSTATGFLDADNTVSLRWQAKTAEITHQALFTVDSTLAALVTPTVVKYTGNFHYDLVQGSASELTLTLPPAQTLTHLDGQQIRDWHVAAEGDHQKLTVSFLKPIENSYDLAVDSEETVTNSSVTLDPPQPLNADRESGLFTISAQDEQVRISAPSGLRQVDASGAAVAAYQFDARPLTLALTLQPIVPEITVADRVCAQLEEARLVVSHALTVDVEKSGVYALTLTPPSGFAVADVHGNGIEDWNIVDGKIEVDFSARALGSRQLNVQLEQALKTFPSQIIIAPLPVTGADKETALIGAASAPGIQLRTGALSGLREISIDRLPDRSNEILAYTASQPGWQLTIATGQLAPRIVADVFNLVTVGDGIVGGSATIRYGIVNQGVQEFKVRIPSSFKNVDFTGPDIRGKNVSGDVWTIDLQDKAWSGYTLVVTYDYQFDAAGGALPVGGVHVTNVERETGSIAVTTASSLQLTPKASGDTLRRIDETELSAADRSFITRPVVLAYRYSGGDYNLALDVARFAQQPVLEAIADRTQITSVLSPDGEMLTQASFMVKNNGKEFQRFGLPPHSRLWSCYVNGQPAKPETDGDWVLVPLPRGANRDQVFAVDILYAQTNGALASTFGKNLVLTAPRTDVPNTYAEWQLFVPPAFRLSHFSGSMSVAEGTTYELLDAWEKFLSFYGAVLREAGGAILVMGGLGILVVALVISAARRGWSGVITLLVVVTMLAVLGAMLMPALASAKRKAQRINSVNNLKEIGLAAKLFAGDHNNRLPMSFEEMKDELGTDKITYDTETEQRFAYLGGGMSLDNLQPDSVLAYSPIVNGHCEVLYADGSVAMVSDAEFAGLSQRGLVQIAAPQNSALAERAMNNTQVMEQNSASLSAKLSPVAQPPGGGGFGGSGYSGHSANNEQSVSALATAPAAPAAVPAFEFNGGSAAPAPVASGIRSIRIDLPESGQPFLFTKVLNVNDQPLSISAHVMPYHSFQTFQMAWQTCAFLFGLGLWWVQWRRSRRSLILTVALVLVLGSVGSLLVEHRALHDALIVGFPVAALAAISIAIWKYWPRRPESGLAPQSPVHEPPPVIIAPAATAVVLLLVLGLSSASAASPNLPVNAPSIVSAVYAGTVNDRVAQLDVILQFASAQPGQTVPVFGQDVAVQQFNVKTGKAELVRRNDGLALTFDTANATVELKLLVKITGDVTKRQLAFAVPPALSSQVKLTLDEPGVEVDFPTAISCRRIPDGNLTRLEAVMGSADQIQLSWTPRVQNAGEIAASVFCQNNSLVAFQGGLLDITSTFDYQITQGELRQARVRLPSGQKLLRVDGDGIRSWETREDRGSQILVVDLLKGVSSSWRLLVETEQSVSALPVTESITVPHALDVQSETGLVALQASDELGFSVQSASGLQRADAAEFLQAVPGAGNLYCAFQFPRPEFDLRVRAAAIQPELEAVTRNYFTVSAGQVSLSAAIDFTIKRAGVFGFQATLPGDYRVDEVDGPNLQQWTVKQEAGQRILEVTLRDRTSGAYPLTLQLSRDLKQLPDSVAFSGVSPLGVSKLTGFVAVSATPGVALNLASSDGLAEIPATALPARSPTDSAGTVLAFKFISSEPNSAPQWELSVAAQTVAAWVRAEIVNSFTLGESLVNGRAVVRYTVANAPVKELQVRVPDGFRDVEITGPDIRSREQDGSLWRIELQNPVLGVCQLTVTWDQPLPEQTNHLELTGVSAVNVERETGLLAISAGPPLQVEESVASGLQRVDAGDFPAWAGIPDNAATLAWHYIHPGYELAVNVHQLDEAAVLQAMIEKAQFTSVVAEDGQMMTEMALSLNSNGRQFLEVALPPGVSPDGVWSAFVAGQPVRPSWRDGKLLLPIQQSAGDDDALSVQLTWVGTNAFPRNDGEVGLVSPGFDVPMKNARWEIYLPPDYEYKNFSGTMAPELVSGAASGASTSSFSILAYSSMEQTKQLAAQNEVQQDVSEAENKLALGDVRGANESFYRARAEAPRGSADGALSWVQQNLQNAAASNLIKAQNEFAFQNSSSVQAGSASAAAAPATPYDAAAAGEQWDKLQQAQEVTSATVQPLHVNLPVRGRHFAFTQVLQTEIDRPMVIQLFAANTKVIHWPIRIFAVTLVFLALWATVAILSRVALRAKSS